MNILDKFCADIGEVRVERNVPMSEHTTFKIGGCADLAAFPKNADELKAVRSFASALGIPFYTVGRGSNLLVSDSGYRGVVIFTSELNAVKLDGCEIYAESGVNLMALSRMACERGLTGLEFACGIPGSVGGAVYMNAGAYGSEMKDIVIYSDWADSDGSGRYVGEEQKFGYRCSVYTDSGKTVTGCKIRLKEGDRDEIARKCRELMDARREKQPLEYPSAGSAFKRCPDRYTARMIDENGLKGFAVGDAQISTKHAGFIVNKGNATSDDVVGLVRAVREKIYEKEGVVIESEIRYLTPEGEAKL